VGHETDAELISRSFDEPRAFEEVFDRHYEVVRLYAQRLVGRSEGEEIAAQTFENAFASRARFDSERFSSARPWLIGITHNLARRHARSERVRRDGAHRAPSDSQTQPEFRAEAEDARRLGPAIRRALHALPDEERQTFMLFALAELSYPEVAQVLRLPLGTVKSRIHRARAALRELLKAEEAMNRYAD
jgi:RNA polymerase sigma factor (sigma-70 family)